MLSDDQFEKKNILDFQLFKLSKKSTGNKSFHSQPETSERVFSSDSKKMEQLEISTRIENIRQSVQRINKLISELTQISDKPNK